MWAVICSAHCSQGQTLEEPQSLPMITPNQSPQLVACQGLTPPTSPDLAWTLTFGLAKETCPTSPFGKYTFCSLILILLKTDQAGGRQNEEKCFGQTTQSGQGLTYRAQRRTLDEMSALALTTACLTTACLTPAGKQPSHLWALPSSEK